MLRTFSVCVRGFAAGIVFAALAIACTPAPTATPTPRPPTSAPVILATIPARGNDTPARIAVNRLTGYVYVALSGHVMVLKGTQVITDIVTAQEWPESIALDEANDLVYVVNTFAGSVSIIQGNHLVVNLSIPNVDAIAVTIEPRSHRAYVVGGKDMRPGGPSRKTLDSNLVVLDGDKVVANLFIDGVSLRVVGADANGYVYAGDRMGAILVFNGLSETRRYEGITIGGTKIPAREMAVSARTGDMYVLDAFEGVRQFREGVLVTEKRIPQQPNKQFDLIRIHPQTDAIYLLSEGTREVVVLENWQEVARVPMLDRADRMQGGTMEIDPYTGHVYATNGWNGMLTVIHGTKALGVLPAGSDAIGINPNNGWVYVSNTPKQVVTVLGYPPPDYTPPAPTPTRGAYP